MPGKLREIAKLLKNDAPSVLKHVGAGAAGGGALGVGAGHLAADTTASILGNFAGYTSAAFMTALGAAGAGLTGENASAILARASRAARVADAHVSHKMYRSMAPTYLPLGGLGGAALGGAAGGAVGFVRKRGFQKRRSELLRKLVGGAAATGLAGGAGLAGLAAYKKSKDS